MTTIDEIFNAMPDDAAAAGHEYLIIDPETRTITVPESERIFGVTGDDLADRKYFMCPRYVGDGLDLAGMFLSVYFRTATDYEDGYLVDDVAVNGEYVTFSWLLSSSVTEYKGTVQFTVCADLPNTAEKRRPDWNTTIASGEVLEGLDPDVGDVVADTSDVVAQLREMVTAQTAAVEATGAAQVQNVKTEGNTQVNTVKATGAQTEADALAAIKAQGEATLATIPADYTALQAQADKLTRDRAAAIVCQAEGELLQITDAGTDPLQGLRIFGKTEQVKTTGAQLIPYPYFNGNKTYNGITWKIHDDGSVDARGTATANSPLYFTNSAHELAPGQYTISGSAPGVAVRVDSTNRETGKWTNGVAISKNGAPVTFTITEADAAAYNYTIYASVESGSTASATIYPMLNAGATALPWEPYSGGVASPSPAWPQELQSIQAPVVGVYGRNLFNLTTASKTVDGVTFTINADKSVTISGTAEKTVYFTLGQFQVPPGEYYLGGCTNGGASHVLYFQKVSDFTGYTQTTTKPTRCTIHDTDARNMMVAVYTGHTLDNVVLRPMLWLAADAVATYEVYKPVQTVTLQNELPGLPVTSGGNYTDAAGQQWLCDEVDLARGVYVQRIKVAEFVGATSEMWNRDYTADESKRRMVTSVYADVVKRTENNQVANILCNQFVKARADDTYSLQERISIDDLGRIHIYHEAHSDSVEAWQTFLAANPITVLCELAEPVETVLSDAEIQAYLALHSNKPTTTVLNDAGAHMVLEYAADPKTYIDNKLAALIAANN